MIINLVLVSHSLPLSTIQGSFCAARNHCVGMCTILMSLSWFSYYTDIRVWVLSLLWMHMKVYSVVCTQYVQQHLHGVLYLLEC